MTALDALLARLPRTSLVVGKGGVGKTTCAAGLAALFAERGDRTLLVSTDPAAALATVVGAPVPTIAGPVDGRPHLDARQLSAAELRQDFLNRWRTIIADIIDRGTYLDRADVDGLVDAALPGSDEIFALLALADIMGDPSSPYARIVVDTAPTGHTLRLLALPETFRALVTMLDAMQDKHRFMVRALTHRYRRDAADDFLDDMRARVDRLRDTLADHTALAALLVTRDEPVILAETRRYLEQLESLHVRVAALVVNGASAATDIPFGRQLPLITIPLAPSPPRGLDEVVALVSGSSATRASTQSGPGTRPIERSSEPSQIVRTLTICGGKGGVGKTTVACALAIHTTATLGGTTLLVSTDPAPSIADALGLPDAPWARADIEAEVPEVPGLFVRQMDATAAFARLRDAYQTRIDALFTALVNRGVDVQHDRAILRDLMALAPPGVDEVLALSVLGDALAEGRFTRIIVDPAPTGHLLRLLEMPTIALDWSHRLMRLMLKYRDVVSLGDTAQELLDFARRTRALDALLRDHARSGLVLVALDEPVVRAETERLATTVFERGLDVGAIVWNRVTSPPSPLPAARDARQFFAKDVRPSPAGVQRLRAWLGTWRELVSSRDS